MGNITYRAISSKWSCRVRRDTSPHRDRQCQTALRGRHSDLQVYFSLSGSFSMRINTFDSLQTLILQKTDDRKPKNHGRQSGECSVKSLLADLTFGHRMLAAAPPSPLSSPSPHPAASPSRLENPRGRGRALPARGEVESARPRPRRLWALTCRPHRRRRTEPSTARSLQPRRGAGQVGGRRAGHTAVVPT